MKLSRTACADTYWSSAVAGGEQGLAPGAVIAEVSLDQGAQAEPLV
jgi:hypothetical protein